MGLRSGDWLGHSRILMCFFLSHSFLALAVCFGSLFNALTGFSALALTVHCPVHCPFDVVQLSCPLSRKTPPKHNVSTSMFDGGDCVLRVIGSIPPPNTARWVDAKELGFGLHSDWNSTRWDLAWRPSPRETDSYFVFLQFANNRTNCCHLLTKLLGDGLVAHSRLV